MIRRRKKVPAAIASEKLLIRAGAPEGSTNTGNVDMECVCGGGGGEREGMRCYR